MAISRRRMIQSMAAAIPTALLPRFPQGGTGQSGAISAGRFTGSWESLKQYKAPDWFRDAKFGIWAHWTAQCVPEQGDWYARRCTSRATPQYEYHVKTYGHPVEVRLHGDRQPLEGRELGPGEADGPLRNAPARSTSSRSPTITTTSTPTIRSTTPGTRSTSARRRTSSAPGRSSRAHTACASASRNHSAHAWHWFQPAYGYDAEGPLAGVRYDACTLTKADGKGKWWEGLDPQDLYTGRNIVMPDGITTITGGERLAQAATTATGTRRSRRRQPGVRENWFLRCQDLVDKYQPDLSTSTTPSCRSARPGWTSPRTTTTRTSPRHGGKLEAVVNAKDMQPDARRRAGRGHRARRAPTGILPAAVADRHLHRRLALQALASSSSTATRPPTGHPDAGRHRQQERQPDAEHPAARRRHDRRRRARLPRRPWPPGCPTRRGDLRHPAVHRLRRRPAGCQRQRPISTSAAQRPYTAEDIRFTTKGDTLYAFALGWPADGKLDIKTLARDSPQYPKGIERVEALGDGAPLSFTRDQSGLFVTLPAAARRGPVAVLKILPQETDEDESGARAGHRADGDLRHDDGNAGRRCPAPAARPVRHLCRGGHALRRRPQHHARACVTLQRPALSGDAPVGRQDAGHRHRPALRVRCRRLCRCRGAGSLLRQHALRHQPHLRPVRQRQRSLPGAAGPAFPGPAKGGFDTQPIADMAPITIGGHKAYGVYIMPGMGFRNNNATRPRRSTTSPQASTTWSTARITTTAAASITATASTNGRAVGTGTMETIYFGTVHRLGQRRRHRPLDHGRHGGRPLLRLQRQAERSRSHHRFLALRHRRGGRRRRQHLGPARRQRPAGRPDHLLQRRPPRLEREQRLLPDAQEGRHPDGHWRRQWQRLVRHLL